MYARHACAALVALTVSLSQTARADGAEPRPSRDSIASDLRGYYGGERASAYVVASLGAASIIGGSVLVTRDSDFARGLGWPLIALGAIEGIGAIVYAFQVGAEIRRYGEALERDPSAYRSTELAHMHGTSARFVFYRLAELGLALGGVAAASYGFVANVDTWKGIGVGVTSIALPFLLIDTINDGRAKRYDAHVRAFDPAPPTNAVPLANSPTPFYVSYAGRF